MALVSCGVWFNFITPNFYEIAQTSGFACVTAGSFFLLSSNIVGDGKIRRWRVALSGVLLSLAVLCRPTLAVYCIAAVAFLIAGFQKLRRQTQEQIKQGKARDGFFRRYGVYILCAAIPFLVIGGAQMLYNYARFGSFMDFGIDYSLTINDFTRSQYHTHLAAIGLYNFLLAFPSVNTAFPFVHSAFSTLDLNGYYFIANQTAIGLFSGPCQCFLISLLSGRIAACQRKKAQSGAAPFAQLRGRPADYNHFNMGKRIWRAVLHRLFLAAAARRIRDCVYNLPEYEKCRRQTDFVTGFNRLVPSLRCRQFCVCI